jgi:hypothetical protein
MFSKSDLFINHNKKVYVIILIMVFISFSTANSEKQLTLNEIQNVLIKVKREPTNSNNIENRFKLLIKICQELSVNINIPIETLMPYRHFEKIKNHINSGAYFEASKLVDNQYMMISNYLNSKTILNIENDITQSHPLRNLDVEKHSYDNENKPEGWITLKEIKSSFNDDSAIYLWDNNIRHSGKRSLRITKMSENKVAAWVQKFDGLKEGEWYEASVWLQTKRMEITNEMLGIFSQVDGIGGALMSINFRLRGVESPLIYETLISQKEHGWQEKKVRFIVPEDCYQAVINLELRYMTGTIWWDDITLKRIIHKDIMKANKLKKNEIDQYGGWKKIKGKPTGFFHTEKINNRWWIITPEGNGFIVIGLQHMYRCKINQEKRKHRTAENLNNWGFNMISHNQDFKNLVYDAQVSPSLWGFPWFPDKAPEIRIPIPKVPNILSDVIAFPDVFDKRFEEIIDKEFKEISTKFKTDPWLLGYFISNELPWDGLPQENISLLDAYFAMPKQMEGKIYLIKFFRKRYTNVKCFNDIYGTNIKQFKDLLIMPSLKGHIKDKKISKEDESAFLTLVAEKYFAINFKIIKKYDPNHMILGVRFHGFAPKEILKVIGKYVDIISYNCYTPIAPLEFIEASYKIHRKPMLISEFSFKAKNSKLLNKNGAGYGFRTQKERALWYKRYVTTLLASPNTVGQVWYKYMDDPPRKVGENSNTGLVNIEEVPYTNFLKDIIQVNQRVYNLIMK